MILKSIENFVKEFLIEIRNKKIHLVSHFDTDGITSAAIFSKAMEKIQIQFSIKILKQLNPEEINLFPEDRVIVLLDLGSSHLLELSQLKNKVFIIDHHELKDKNKYENIQIINPHLFEKSENLCAAELTYLVSKKLSEENQELSHLAIIGMVGDTLEKEITPLRNQIIKDSSVQIKKGLLIYPSTRPLDKTLEYSSRPFIPGVTGDSKGTYELLNEAGIKKNDKTYKALIDLNKEEMKRLVTAVMLRLSGKEKSNEYIGDLYLIKFFNKIEDARELSAIINACSRMNHSETSLLMCLGNNSARKRAERLYVKYRQHIISGLRYIDKNKKIEGREYVIINAQDKIKDTLIGTMASILSFSSIYEEGTIIIAMAYNNDKIKVSTRMAGKNSKNTRNLKELMDCVTNTLGGESGGHQNAAGCTIERKNEEKFIELIKSKLDIELIRIDSSISNL
jgi:single-stranded-DNA-specific exonuclease